MKLFDYPLSGNGYKVRLLLSHLGRAYEYVPVDILAGEAKTDSFLKKNPVGKVPVLECDDGLTLPESNAILFFLSQGTRYWPDDTAEQSLVLSWLFFEQRSHMPNIGGARYWLSIQKSEMTSFQRELVQEMQTKAKVALGVLDRQLAINPYIAGHRYTIADIALYAYTHLAHEANIELAPYSAITTWIKRVEDQPAYVDINQWPTIPPSIPSDAHEQNATYKGDQ